MKKLFAVVLFLCMFCTCAFAESTALSWENVPEETQAAGQFTQIALADDLALLCWIPANMAAVDVSTIETEVSPVEAYQTEDGTYTVSIFALQVNGVDEYLGSLEANGAELGDLDINGIEAVSFVQKDNGVEGVVIPVTDELVLSIACTPVDGDEGKRTKTPLKSMRTKLMTKKSMKMKSTKTKLTKTKSMTRKSMKTMRIDSGS